MSLDGLLLEVEGSVGVALYPDHGEDVAALLGHADLAMYAAKELHSGMEFYAKEQDEHSARRLTLVGELRRAIGADQLVLHYQPKIEVRTGRTVSLEALVRWKHPQLGMLFPDEFIPLAEHTGLIRSLTQAVLNAALSQQSAWRDQGIDLPVAVNISGRDLVDTQLPDSVAVLLDRWQTPVGQLELELPRARCLRIPLGRGRSSTA